VLSEQIRSARPAKQEPPGHGAQTTPPGRRGRAGTGRGGVRCASPATDSSRAPSGSMEVACNPDDGSVVPTRDRGRSTSRPPLVATLVASAPFGTGVGV
jgi:hypothetical protein